MTPAEKYVAAAYLVVFATLFVYVVIIASKLARLAATLEELTARVRERGR